MPCIRTSVLTASLRQNADGACLIITRTRRRALFVSDSLSRQYPSLLTRTPARAHSQAERHCLALSPPRGQGSGRQYTPQKNARTQSNMTTAESIRTVPPDLCRRVRHGDLFIFCFLGGRLRTFLRAFRLRNGRREVSPPRIPAPRQVYKSEAGRLYLILPRTQRHTHQTRPQTMPQKNSGLSQPPSGKGLSEYLLQSAKGAGSRTLSCKLPTRRKIKPRPLPIIRTRKAGARTKPSTVKPPLPSSAPTNHRPQSRHLRRRSAVNSVRGRPFEATFRIVLRFFSQSGTILSGELP